MNKKSRPYPWVCTECAHLTVFPTTTDYQFEYLGDDGVLKPLTVHGMHINRCKFCQFEVLDLISSEQIEKAKGNNG